MSYEFKGTPGPWRYGEFTQYKNGQVHGYYIQSNRLPVLAGTLNWPDCAEANARAIAAVPELIDVLAGIVERWDQLVPEDEISEEHRQARAALAKATGEQGWGLKSG